MRTEKCQDQSVSIKRIAKALVTFDTSLLTTCPKSGDEQSTDLVPVKQNSLQKREFLDVLRKVGIVVGLIVLAPFMVLIGLILVSLAIQTSPIWLSVLFVIYAYKYIEQDS
jgi:hypothetical protein